ncbi:MAG TPA: sodium:pantothenate symporter [Cerasibacillus sp.]|uniref:sodium:solute symporter family protein n=1 Tax=Cerasibacillus sp. TaxID=2498711 RepID=UPI002F3F0EB5
MVSTWLWIQFTLFMLIMVGVSIYAARKTKTMEDFAISGASLGPYVLGLSLAATLFSAATFMGYPGYSYAWGFSNLWLYLAIFISAPLGFITIAKTVHKQNDFQNSLSLPDWLGDYYNSDFLRVGSGLIMLFNLFYIAAQFSAGAQIFQNMLGVNYLTGLIAIAVIVVGYVYVGGSYADVYTDAVQAVMMAVTGLIVFVSGIIFFGDGSITSTLKNVSDNLAQQDGKLLEVFNPDSNYYAFSAVIGLLIIQFSFSAQPQLFNKVLSLKRRRDLRKMIIVYIVAAAMCLFVLFGGLYARVAVPGLEAADLALLEYVAWGFPAFLAAFVAVVILAAALSTTDGLFVVMSTVFANDIFKKVLVKRNIIKVKEENVDKIALKISRIAVLGVGVVAALLVLNPPSFLADLMWVGISGVSAGTLGPIMYAVFGKKKASPRAAEGSMIIGMTAYLIIVFTGIESSPLAAGGWATLIGIISMFVLANIFKRPVEA